MAKITKDSLKKLCRELELYSVPELNDVLYLHYKGYAKIENLDEYTELKVLWLEGNGLTKIEGLDNQTNLRCLYLQENCIEKMENLENLTQLATLNLSQNYINTIEGLEHVPNLATLLFKSNRLTSVEDLRGVLQCEKLSALDVSSNKLCDPAILDVLAQMPALKVLYLKGNPVVQKIPFYRKTVISTLKILTYLDDRPVFEEERLACEAWAKDGAEGERRERKRQR
eukprot:215966_1